MGVSGSPAELSGIGRDMDSQVNGKGRASGDARDEARLTHYARNAGRWAAARRRVGRCWLDE